MAMRRATAPLLPLVVALLLTSGCEEPVEEADGDDSMAADVDNVEATPTPTPTPARPASTAWSGVEVGEDLRKVYPSLDDADILLRPMYDDQGEFVVEDELVLVEPVDDLGQWRDKVEASLLRAGAAEAGEPWPGDEPVLRAGLGNIAKPDHGHAASMTFAGTIGDNPDEPEGYVVLMLGYTFDPDTGEIDGDPAEPIGETFTLGGLQFEHDPDAPEPDVERSRDDDWEPPDVVAGLADAVSAAQPTASAVMRAAGADAADE